VTDGEGSPRTLFEKIWGRHRILEREDGQSLLYVDRHLLQDGSAPAFEMLCRRGLAPRAPHRVVVDLQTQTVVGPDGESHGFHIDPFPKYCLLQGLDERGYAFSQAERIADFERGYERGDV
jgi:homoaconitase/3-isopropylmalate dehydratase large subunit